jgi:hypothetical protein
MYPVSLTPSASFIKVPLCGNFLSSVGAARNAIKPQKEGLIIFESPRIVKETSRVIYFQLDLIPFPLI